MLFSFEKNIDFARTIDSEIIRHELVCSAMCSRCVTIWTLWGAGCAGREGYAKLETARKPSFSLSSATYVFGRFLSFWEKTWLCHQADLELLILLPLPPKKQDDKTFSTRPRWVLLWDNLRYVRLALSMEVRPPLGSLSPYLHLLSVWAIGMCHHTYL